MDMIFNETHKEEEQLDNEELLELLTIVSNEAFSETDVYKVKFEQIAKSKIIIYYEAWSQDKLVL